MTARSLDEAVEESHAAPGATGSGDIEPFMALYSDGDDITFGNPFEAFVRGQAAVREAAERAASRYRDGEVVGFERVATHLGDRLACVAEVEHVRAKVGGSDSPASIALRATSVFREENGVWKLVHRHADPITFLRPRSQLSATSKEHGVRAAIGVWVSHTAGTVALPRDSASDE